MSVAVLNDALSSCRGANVYRQRKLGDLEAAGSHLAHGKSAI